MDSALAMASSSFLITRSNSSPNPFFPIVKPTSSKPSFFCIIKASSTSNSCSPNLFTSALKTTAAALIFSAAVLAKPHPPARAHSPPPTLESEAKEDTEVIVEKEEAKGSPLTEFLESGTESIEAVQKLLEQKLEAGEDEEALTILRKLSIAQPESTKWKFLMARVLSEMGKREEAREVFEEILAKEPLSFKALFENALLMDRCGEGEEVIKRLEIALKIAEEEENTEAIRDVRLMIAQFTFLRQNVEEALRMYEELEREDPKDFRPPFCKGMIYSLLDKEKEAREHFAKFRELAPKRFDVEGFLRTSLSKMKLFEFEEGN